MSDEKPVLAIETSEHLCGASVYFSPEKYFEVNIRLKNSHSEKIFDVIDYVIKSSGVTLADLGWIAVSSGPGSFTGLRIGMAAAKGIAFASSLPVVPVPTFEAMALYLKNYFSENDTFIIANRVNSEEAYYAKFQIKANNYIFADKLKLIKLEELKEAVKDQKVFGNAVTGYTDYKNNFNISAPFPRYVAEWSKKFGKKLLSYDYSGLEPDYVKNFIIKDKI
jgi:tRNA threonylcarbamoyladenosine biosynthesis protein TsaB